MIHTSRHDVVIMGAGFAGVTLARHLLLREPGLRIALIDPRGADRDDNDLKVGESMVEIASLFVGKELGLVDYLIEHHTPKAGLNFHWPRDGRRTDTLADYFSVWSAANPTVASYHMNRAKLERDILAMDIAMGAEFHHGHVVDLELNSGGRPHRVTVKLKSGAELVLSARHLVDAGGRRFLIGRRTANLIEAPGEIFRLRNASSWVRVRGADRSIFDAGLYADRASTSRYYATNHFLGWGHWCWMIPSAHDELSIGVVYHKDRIPERSLCRREQLLDFWRANHRILGRLVDSGHPIDFQWRRQIAYRSRRMLHPDNWYVLGDAAYVIDAFYSLGTSGIALAAESVSDVIRRDLRGDRETEERRALYDRFNVGFGALWNGLARDVGQHLGDASAMSWRIYLEWTWWFGMLVPMYLGRWHLDPDFLRQATPIIERNNHGLLGDLYAELGEVAAAGTNIGMLDATRPGELYRWSSAPPAHLDESVERTRFEARRANVFRTLRRTHADTAVWQAKLAWRAGGPRRLFSSRSRRILGRLARGWATATAGEAAFRLRTLAAPDSSIVAAQERDFRSYRAPEGLVPWGAGDDAAAVKPALAEASAGAPDPARDGDEPAARGRVTGT
jgi:flavin-dependent dehydrogenase